MKILGISASPRQGKSTCQALKACLDAAAESGAEVRLIELADRNINGCLACGACMKKLQCSQDDDFAELIPPLTDPELGALILASPVYFCGMTSQAKAFLDRCVMLRRNGFLLRDKVGGALAVGGFRNGGQELTMQSIHAAMLTQDMIIVSEGMPTSHLGAACFSGGANGMQGDDFGLKLAASLGRRVAEAALKLA